MAYCSDREPACQCRDKKSDYPGAGDALERTDGHSQYSSWRIPMDEDLVGYSLELHRVELTEVTQYTHMSLSGSKKT